MQLIEGPFSAGDPDIHASIESRPQPRLPGQGWTLIRPGGRSALMVRFVQLRTLFAGAGNEVHDHVPQVAP
jgi:hypothetical protein